MDFKLQAGLANSNIQYLEVESVTGPGGSRFASYQISPYKLDQNPTVSDNNHEWIISHGYGGITLNPDKFADWGTTCHGIVEPPSGHTDSYGVNLGINPRTNKWNDILWSPSNSKAAFIEYTLNKDYVMMRLMTFDWGRRGSSEMLQIVKYIEHIKRNFPK